MAAVRVIGGRDGLFPGERGGKGAFFQQEERGGEKGFHSARSESQSKKFDPYFSGRRKGGLGD